jgi:hypothetical protein
LDPKNKSKLGRMIFYFIFESHCTCFSLLKMMYGISRTLYFRDRSSFLRNKIEEQEHVPALAETLRKWRRLRGCPGAG